MPSSRVTSTGPSPSGIPLPVSLTTSLFACRTTGEPASPLVSKPQSVGIPSTSIGPNRLVYPSDRCGSENVTLQSSSAGSVVT